MRATSLAETVLTIDKYNLIEKIGEGFLGPVYRGFDQELGTPIVIRILYDAIRWDAKLEELFSREMRTVAALQHSNIARILGYGREGHTRYIAMESLGSGTLENLIAQNSHIPVEKKLSIMIQISEGLNHAHKNGVLHQDLVPGKIHLAPDGSVKIRDFAVAHMLMKHLPRPAIRFGAPIYLCPEQIQHKPCDARSDIFSIGTIFYELITHCHPFHDRDSNRALDNIVADTPIPTFEKFPDAPPGIWTILRTCLARNAEERYQSAEELSNACRQLLVSMAEDTQLVLSELYASLSPLRKAASQPNASRDIVNLTNEIERLVKGEREADYAHLDQLMNKLMEQYPSIQTAANTPPSLDSLCPQLPPEPPEIPLSTEPETALPEMDPEPPSEPQPTPLDSILPEPELLLSSAKATEELPLLLDPGSLDSAVPAPELSPEVTTGKTAVEPALAEPLPEASVQHLAAESGPEKPVFTLEMDAPVEVAPPLPIPEPAATTQPEAEVQNPSVPAQPFQPKEPVAIRRRRRIPRPSYRMVVVLLSILVIAAAGYIALGTEAAASLRHAWNLCLPYSTSLLQSIKPEYLRQASNKTTGAAETGMKAQSASIEALMNQARDLAARHQIDESRVILHKILETRPGYEPAVAALHKLGAQGKAVLTPLEATTLRISGLISSGNLQLAKTEIDKLQPNYPEAALGLRKRWQACVNARQAQETGRKDEEQPKALLRQKEEDWNRELSEFLSRGKYGEASGALSLWLAANPGNMRAQDLNARVQEIQRQLKNYSAAIADNRYPEALAALNSAERLNPSDPNLSEMRRQVESRRAEARATLTVQRLGPKAALLLDGKPVGKDGELENEPVAIGSHTLGIENSAGLIASRVQDYSEGQHVTLVYDSVKQTLRSMTEADRELLTQRKAIENVERYSLDHDHGLFRGSCRGVLSLNALDVAYSPSAGTHGFRIPFKLLKLKAEGKAVSFYNISDNSHFRTFQFQDAQSAYKFRQKWDELKALVH